MLPLLSKLASTPGSGTLRALLLAPTRELADQIHREVLRLSAGRKLKVCLLKRSLIAALSARQDRLALGRYDVLISTPMRLVHMLQAELVDLSGVETVVLDEVDKLFEADSWRYEGAPEAAEGAEEGDDAAHALQSSSSFLAQMDEVLAQCTRPTLQRCLFSATTSQLVLELSQSLLTRPVQLTIGRANTGADTIDQQLLFVSNEEGKLLAIRQLVQTGQLRPPVLVFVQSKERAKALLRELVFDGLNADSIHAERTQQQRDLVIAGFRRGDIWVLICTDLMVPYTHSTYLCYLADSHNAASTRREEWTSRPYKWCAVVIY